MPGHPGTEQGGGDTGSTADLATHHQQTFTGNRVCAATTSGKCLISWRNDRGAGPIQATSSPDLRLIATQVFDDKDG
jgi:hypothetical protein